MSKSAGAGVGQTQLPDPVSADLLPLGAFFQQKPRVEDEQVSTLLCATAQHCAAEHGLAIKKLFKLCDGIKSSIC